MVKIVTSSDSSGYYSSSPFPKLPDCFVLLDKREFARAAARYVKPVPPVLTPTNSFASMDSDEDRLEIDESASDDDEPMSMPNLDPDYNPNSSPVKRNTNGRFVKTIDWAPDRNPVYGSAEFIPKEAKKRARRKEYVDAGTQHMKDDGRKYCDKCIQGENMNRLKLDLILQTHGSSLDELTEGGKITPELIEKIKIVAARAFALETIPQQNPQPIQVSMQVKRITKRALPGLLPLPNLTTTNNDVNETQTENNNNAQQGFEYTEENIRMSQFQYMPLSSTANPFNLQSYQPSFFTPEGETTPTPSCESPSYSLNNSLNFYVNTLDMDDGEKTPANDDEKVSETEVTEKTDGSDKKEDENLVEMTPIGEKTPLGESTPLPQSEGNSFETLTGENTPIPENNDSDDALVIGTDTDFVDGFDEKIKENTPTNPDLNKSLERQSILHYEDDSSTEKRNRFAKIGSQMSKRPASLDRYNRNKPANKRQRSRPSPSHSITADDNISPFKSNLFPQMNAPSVPGKSTASHRLFMEFTKICRNQLYGTCNKNINCNGNHTFPDGAWVKSMLDQMSFEEVQKFIKSCYKSVPCCFRYFHILSNHFGTHNMKHHLVEAIPMAESHPQLMQNYKWIVNGLIRAGVTSINAVSTLLETRKNFTPLANRMIVEIIVKTKLESHFLGKLVEISQHTTEVFDVDMFHKFMEMAMLDLDNIEGWKTLIENILEKLGQQDEVVQLLDQELITKFLNYI